MTKDKKNDSDRINLILLKKIGISYRNMEAQGIINPVIDVKINFRKPALFDDVLTLTTTLQLEYMELFKEIAWFFICFTCVNFEPGRIE
mgnify:CR=1 FL=1